MADLSVRRRRLVLLASSVLIAVAVGWPVARYIRKANKKPRPAPYGLQLVDDAGRALGKAHGPIQIVFDPCCIYRLKPNQQTKRATINELGGRGAAPNGDGPTVAFLGGSACFGQELANDDELFTALLQRKNAPRRWLNFGCPGYESSQELSFYVHRLRELAPDVVVSLGGWNDAFGVVRGPPRRPGLEGFNGMFFELRDRLHKLHAGGRTESVPPPDSTPDESFERACRVYIENMLDLHRLAKARGAAFLWVMQPELGAKANRTQYENDVLLAWERHYGYSPSVLTRRYAELRRRAEAAADPNGVAFLDVNETESWTSNGELLFADPVHPNAAGHQALAEVVGPAVERLRKAAASGPMAN